VDRLRKFNDRLPADVGNNVHPSEFVPAALLQRSMCHRNYSPIFRLFMEILMRC
jgi:hypothetical protein